MITLRKSADRGHANHGWLDTYHSFSFADYYDPKEMGFGSLRVINEDVVSPGMGFGTHGHRDMEIITYILEGALQHKDSMGNGSVIKPGDVQRMSAGTGVTHSEFNASQTEPVHLLQIWIQPKFTGIKPGYEEKVFNDKDKRGKLRLIASFDAREGSAKIHQDASLYSSIIDNNQQLTYNVQNGRVAYVHVARGSVDVNGQTLQQGDGAKIQNESLLTFNSKDSAEFLLFDMA
jgi:redox-sensitive bicupin YhaK (pirin superfamily)